jgi:tripartite-type tricarboxylate transporter receptor subunit TctC
MQFSMLRTVAALSAVSLLLAAGDVSAQQAQPSAAGAAPTFPSKPIRFIVPSSASGANDVLARLFGQKMFEHWGQQVVVDNRPGAGGIIGSELTAKAPPDGYTILIVAPGYSLNPSLYAKLPYDTLNDFARVCLVAFAPNVLVVHPSVPARTVKELIALAKAKPNSLNYATSGIGTSGWLAVELFKRMAAVEMTHIPYKGAGEATAAAVGGQVHLLFTAPGASIPQIKAGRLRALGVTGSKRVGALPEVPTIAEAGLPGYEQDGPYGVLAPAKTPKPIIDKLNAELIRILKLEDVRARMEALGFEPSGSTPEQYTARVRDEMVKWAKLFKDAGIKPE